MSRHRFQSRSLLRSLLLQTQENQAWYIFEIVPEQIDIRRTFIPHPAGHCISQCYIPVPDGAFVVKGGKMNQIMKPLTVARHEFVSALTNLVNESQLPPFVIEAVLKDVYTDIRIIAQRQLESDLQKYRASQSTSKSGEA